MGHANLTNISEAFNRQLYAKGTVTIAEVAAHCGKHGETVHASEGEYDEDYMIRMSLENVLDFLLSHDEDEGGPFIVAVDMTPEQEKIYKEWRSGKVCMDWDCGDDGNGGQYGILDSIKWRFAPGARKKYPNDLPVLGNFSN